MSPNTSLCQLILTPMPKGKAMPGLEENVSKALGRLQTLLFLVLIMNVKPNIQMRIPIGCRMQNKQAIQTHSIHQQLHKIADAERLQVFKVVHISCVVSQILMWTRSDAPMYFTIKAWASRSISKHFSIPSFRTVMWSAFLVLAITRSLRGKSRRAPWDIGMIRAGRMTLARP